MNDPFFAVLVLWQTSNWRHQKSVVTMCKNYGLKRLTMNSYVGALRKKERDVIYTQLVGLFVGKREKISLILLCKSCYDGALIPSWSKENIHNSDFEIVG